MSEKYYWDTNRGQPRCIVIERQPTSNGPDMVIIELTESIDGDQFMQAGQRKVTSGEYVKAVATVDGDDS